MKTQTLKIFIAILMAGCFGTGSLLAQITLNGSYTIGASGTADFSTIKQALDTLATATVTGDVVFTVEAGTYNDVLLLNAANNGSFSVTFQGEDKETTIIQPDGQFSGSGFYIENANHFVFRDFTYEMDSISSTKVSHTSDITRGFRLKNTSDILFDNLDVINSRHEGFNASSWDDYIASTYSMDSVTDISITNCLMSGAGIHVLLNWFNNVHIENNYFEKGQRQVLSFNSSTVGAGNLTIRNNVMAGPIGMSRSMINIVGNSSSFPATTTYTNGITIENNIIDCGEWYGNQYGISLELVSGVTLNNNIIKNGFQAIRTAVAVDFTVSKNYLHGTYGPVMEIADAINAQISDNIVEGSNQAVGLASSNNVSFIGNTVKTTGPWGMYCNAISGSFEVKNNIFEADTNCAYQLRIDNAADDILDMDYNAFSTSVQECIRVYNYTHNGSTISDLYYNVADWQAVQPYFDQNSEQLTHSFRSSTDLHIGNDSLYRFGIPYANLEYDYDNDWRDTAGVDVGADQFTGDTANFTFADIDPFTSYCQTLGDSHQICFNTDMVANAKSTFMAHSTEDDASSDFEVFDLTYTLDSGQITVMFDVYNNYKWHSIEETYYLPNPGDRDSSNIILTSRDTSYEYVETPFHFIVTNIAEEDSVIDAIDSELAEAIQVYPNPSVNGTFKISSASKVEIVEAYDLLGNSIHISYSTTAKEASVDIPSSGMYLLKVTTAEGTTNRRVIVL